MLDPFGRVRTPGDFTRQGRVALLGEAFDALLRGEMPSDEARVFLAGGGMAWLQRGGDLVGDFWRVKAVQGSNHTPAVIWSLLQSASRSATGEKKPESIGQSDSPDFRKVST